MPFSNLLIFFYFVLYLGNCLAEECIDSKVDQKDSKAEQKKEPFYQWTGSVTFISDYRSRGISQTMRQPAVQGELKLTQKDGFYFKSWASNVDGTGNFLHNTSLEWDFFIGFKKQPFSFPLEVEAGLLFYYYPAGRANLPENVSYDTIEYYAILRYKGFNIKLYQTLTDYFGVNSKNPPVNWQTNRFVRPNGHSKGSWYLETNFEWFPLPKLKNSYHVGYQYVTNYPQISYLDWQIGLIYSLSWFDVAIYYVATNGRKDFFNVPDSAYHPKKRNLAGPGYVLAVTKEF